MLGKYILLLVIKYTNYILIQINMFIMEIKTTKEEIEFIFFYY